MTETTDIRELQARRHHGMATASERALFALIDTLVWERREWLGTTSWICIHCRCERGAGHADFCPAREII